MSTNRELGFILRRYCVCNSILLKDIAEYLKIPRSNVTVWSTRIGKMPLKHYESLIHHPSWDKSLLVQYKDQLLNMAPLTNVLNDNGEQYNFLENGLLPVFSNEYMIKGMSISESIRANERLLPHRPPFFGNKECSFYVISPNDVGDIRRGDLMCVSYSCESPYRVTIEDGRLCVIKGGTESESFGVTTIIRSF